MNADSFIFLIITMIIDVKNRSAVGAKLKRLEQDFLTICNREKQSRRRDTTNLQFINSVQDKE